MSLLDSLVKNEIALDIQESHMEDIAKLSDEIDKNYPGISTKYQTIESFVTHNPAADICFYHTEIHTWDGYMRMESYLKKYPKSIIYTAKEIIDDDQVKEINEEDFMSIFS